MRTTVILALFAALLLPAGCNASKNHFYTPVGRPLFDLDYLWEEVDRVFPGALPEQVTLVPVGGPHAVFMIESNSIGIPTQYRSNIRRGKICRMLTHLALHRLSGGDDEVRGRCFDNDVVFLDQAIAGYMDRKAAGLLEEKLENSGQLAADLFRGGKMSVMDLRDWDAFYYRGYWSDQYKEWNLDGMEALLSLGDYLERNYTLTTMGLVFERLGEGGTLDSAMQEIIALSMETLLTQWRDEVLAKYPKAADDDKTGDAPGS